MKTKILFIICSLLLIFNGKAQTKKPAQKFITEEKNMYGYTIRLMQAGGGTYGYDILKGKTVIVHQLQNPFMPMPDGLRRKEDVFKVAEWVITELKRTGIAPLKVPLELAADLNILLPGQDPSIQ